MNRDDYSTVFRGLQSVRRYDRPITEIPTVKPHRGDRVAAWFCTIGIVILVSLRLAGVL